jgi:hypothetical protein
MGNVIPIPAGDPWSAYSFGIKILREFAPFTLLKSRLTPLF